MNVDSQRAALHTILVETTVAGLREQIRQWRTRTPCGRLALVPTMGALHAGHLRLVDAALERADAVVVTIFVNPTQFAPGEDFDSYPRTLPADVAKLATRQGVLCVFAPQRDEMYPPGDMTRISLPALSEPLCGQSRPHFFGGVATVVGRLLNIAMAEIAVFGEKDFQQLQVIRRMVRDLHHPTEIVGVATVREDDGLALSSRNQYLTPEQRAGATSISRGLFAMQQAVTDGQLETAPLLDKLRAQIEHAGGRVDYVSVVDCETLRPIKRIDQPARALVAAWFGQARLIDNVAL